MLQQGTNFPRGGVNRGPDIITTLRMLILLLSLLTLTRTNVYSVKQFYVRAISPGQNSHKVAGDGGMKEGPHVAEVSLELLELNAAADSHHLVNLDVPVEHRHARTQS